MAPYQPIVTADYLPPTSSQQDFPIHDGLPWSSHSYRLYPDLRCYRRRELFLPTINVLQKNITHHSYNPLVLTLQLAAQAIPEWSDASLISVPNLIFTLVGAGNAGRFVMVLMALSVTANTAPTIYSCGLSAMVVLPFLVRSEFEAPRWEEGVCQEIIL